MVNTGSNKDKRSRVLLIVIISILFIINAGLIYNLINKNDDLELTKEELVSTQAELEELEAIKAELDLALDSLQGQNERLDSIISSRDAEIQQKVARVQRMIASGQATKRQLEEAREELAQLRAYITRYTAEIDSLSQENEFLRDENYAVKKDLEFERERAKNLESENDDLSKKVAIGSKMQAENLIAQAVKDKWNGKEREVKRLSAADRFKIEFSLANNDIAELGERTIYLKIITPSKATLSNEKAGSGTFTFKGEQSLYTTKKVIDFQNKNEKVVFYWDKSEGLVDGDYEAYLFCDDFIIGKTKFELK